jgi:hypothetical protein
VIDYTKPALGYLVRSASNNLDSPLDAGARARAEEAARFLSYERIGGVASSGLPASFETASILLDALGMEYVQGLSELEAAEVICNYLLKFDAPFVLVLRDREIRAAIERLTANVCAEEIVAPGGIISVHRIAAEGGCGPHVVVQARTMVLNFSFTDFVEMELQNDAGAQ